MWNRKLGRTADHRKAMLRNMATSLIIDGQIETTEMKAKELSAVVDKLKTLFGGEEEEITDSVPVEEEYYTTTREKYHEENGVAGSKMIL